MARHQHNVRNLLRRQTWSAVGSMALCVALLIASEFMPVSLLTPIAHDLHATDGMAGQAISISGLFAVVTVSYCYNRGPIRSPARVDGLDGIMLLSLVLIATAPNFLVLMVARALLGIVIGGFWSLATATVMRLVPAESVPKALGIVYTGNAVATALLRRSAATWAGSSAGAAFSGRWRPSSSRILIWQWISLPAHAAASRQSHGQAIRASQEAQCRVRHAGRHVDVCRRVYDLYVPAAVP